MTASGIPARRLTLDEVALIADGLSETLSDEGARCLAQVIRTDPRYAAEIEQLEALAREAGLRPEDSLGYLSAARALDEALTALLAADGWKHPAEVLDPDGTRGIPYAPLIRLARERERKAAGEERETILEVRQRLKEALAAETAEESILEQFLARLLELPPERAIPLLARTTRVCRERLTPLRVLRHHREQIPDRMPDVSPGLRRPIEGTG